MCHSPDPGHPQGPLPSSRDPATVPETDLHHGSWACPDGLWPQGWPPGSLPGSSWPGQDPSSSRWRSEDWWRPKVPPHLLGSEASTEDGSGLRAHGGESQRTCGQVGALGTEGQLCQARTPGCTRSVGRKRGTRQWFVPLHICFWKEVLNLPNLGLFCLVGLRKESYLPCLLLLLTQSCCLSHHHIPLQTCLVFKTICLWVLLNPTKNK